MCILPFILSLVSSLLIIRAAENSCKSNQWQCRDGACISLENVCDAANDCSDDSDETLPFCRRITSGPSTSCILPPYPAHGTYEVEDLRDARPGQSLASFALTVQCRKGYGVMNPNGDGSGIQQVYCVNGKWHQDMPKCVRFCKLDPDPSVRYMCYYPGKGVEVCKHYVPPGMSVEPVCNRPIYYSNELLPNMRCLSGVWNYIALCKAECGRVTPGGLQLAIGATKAKRGELPWHVGIYRKTTNPYTQICGGSLVSNNIVISAAHCFWRDVLLPAADFGVAGGNIYRSWDNEEDVGAQKSDVKEIKIPSLFEGESANFQEDIAVLTLMTPFNFTTYIRPVCLDFGVYFEKLQLQHGKLGKVAGWGLTAAHGQASHILRVLEMPFISVEICISTLPETFREYITGDKFCAGYTNGTALCQGDSGGGLAFSERERGVDRYYLRGIVSAAPNDEDKLCNDNVYTTFTKITKHQEFIKEAFAASARKTCPLYSFQCDDGSCVDPGADCNGRQDCSDGSDESDELCRVTPSTAAILFPQTTNQAEFNKPVLGSFQNQTISPDNMYHPQDNSTKASIPMSLESHNISENESRCEGGITLPWPVAIFNTTKGDLHFICGGTLLSDRHLITVAHCVFKYKEVITNQIVVKLGLENYEEKYDEYQVARSAVTRKINSLSVPESYKNSSPKDDIAILTLIKKVDFNGHYVNAACLWKENSESTAAFGHGYTIGDFPWPVAIYTILKSTYICGGTLISNKHVITTAHSLPTSVNKIIVKLGLYNAKKISDTIAVTRTVISTSVHPEYNALYSENDIAILKLNETVEFKAYIRAACLWNGYSEVPRVVGDRGYFVGWSGDIGSPERLQMYVVKPDDCRVNNRTLEKTLCTRDFTRALSSGGGFYLSNEGSWRLRGVYSLESKCLGTEPSCTPYSLFIDIAQYLPWINSVMSEKLYKPLVDQTTYKEQERNIPIYQLTQNQTLSNQRDRKTETLKPIITQTPERDTFQSNSRCNDTGHGYTIGDFPWPVAIYTILKSTYICGGTLISNKHVITTAHSLPTSVNKIMVKLGLYNAKKISDTIAVTRTVISTSVHPEYNALYSENDIAILKLNETVEFKAYIRAACLWNGYSEVTRVVGDRGYFVGWSGDIGSPERLQMYVVKPDDCRVNNRTLEKTLCTRDFTRALSSGGGFYLSNEGSWRLRGVYSLESKCLGTEPSCTPYSLFIDIAQYLQWINSVLSEN
ncbi:unnamed protein product [Arctia plantaginis]|uniref:Uncharacterized protein n=1 Tax=Arctia plantaginis TaxID=874455 RepID=A0A8S0YSS6_ARCPL|nr:unnamed protein product [Arctia plantaginis]